MFEFCNNSAVRRRLSAARQIAWLCLMLGAPLAAQADGRFEIIAAESRLVDSVWVVDARVDLELSREAVDALQNGVTLAISFQYEVAERRRFWPDRLVATKVQNFELQYLSLSERYLVRRVGTDTQNSYATLFSALRYMGQVKDFPLDTAPPDSGAGSYYMAMRAVLDREQLPGPLQVLAFWRGDFGLESDWYRWKPNG